MTSVRNTMRQPLGIFRNNIFVCLLLFSETFLPCCLECGYTQTETWNSSQKGWNHKEERGDLRCRLKTNHLQALMWEKQKWFWFCCFGLSISHTLTDGSEVFTVSSSQLSFNGSHAFHSLKRTQMSPLPSLLSTAPLSFTLKHHHWGTSHSNISIVRPFLYLSFLLFIQDLEFH